MQVGEDEVKFKPTKTVKFVDEEKGTCMKVDSLIPSVEQVFPYMVARDAFEKCLTKSHTMTDLDHEHPLKDHPIS